MLTIDFKGVRYEPGADVVEETTVKLRKLEKFLPGDALAHMELEQAVGSQRKGDIWRAVLQIDHEGAQYRAESTKAKLDHAVTTVLRDVTQELSRAHKKAEDRKRKGSGFIKSVLRGFGGE